MTTPRLTKPTIGVLEVLLRATEEDPAWGLQICSEADLGSGTVYPILDRLTSNGWVTARQETEPHPGRPPRRYYALSGAGRRNATEALAARELRRRKRFVVPKLSGGPV